MTTLTTNRYGPGKIYAAPFGTAVPTSLSSTLDPAFILLGNTVDGSTFTYQIQTADLMIEESYVATAVAATGVTETLAFNLADYTANHLNAAFNNGIVASPSGNASVTAPALNNETRLSIVWVSDDGLERWYWRKCINTGSVALARRKAPNVTTIAFNMRVEDPLGGLTRWDGFLDSTLNI